MTAGDSTEPGVTLDPVKESEAAVLANLLELYVHDLSAVFRQVVLGADGRFGYAKLPRYFSDPDRHRAFFVRVQGRLAGFVLATHGSPAVDDPNVWDVAEFFVVRAERRRGVGSAAAALLWNTVLGPWAVRVSEGNAPALAFWRELVAEFSAGRFSELTRPSEPYPWRVFRFESTP
ncbi:MAG TPA: GNAT family N-acetyltransferase [Polyangiaceae bacterium]|jgi:predicted acetyltransferase|nr:GNAT family N-acetyltransferase [Polyangiaceae bacterium]